MFYAHIILAKKGPLARVWLAAHWDKKITKAHVFETNIEKSVEGIMQPKVKLALRTSGHLLLGVVRIYSRKAKYLLADCNEAFVKIKMAFRPGMVDLPEGHREANVNAITLPEVFHDFDTALPELNDIDIEAQFSVNQSRADEITMREDYGSLSLSLQDDGFGDMGFDGDTPDLMRGALDSNLNDQLFEDQIISGSAVEDNAKMHSDEIPSARLEGSGFDVEFGQPELFEDDLFGESPLEGHSERSKSKKDLLQDDDDDDLDRFNTGAASPSSCGHSEQNEIEENRAIETCIDGEPNVGIEAEQPPPPQNEDESFALAPIDASAYKGVTKTKRKRKLIVDEIKNISGEEMKAQLANTSDIVTTLDLAPPTKRLMYWKETGGVEKLFSLPSRQIPARVLFINYSRHLVSHFTPLEDFSYLGPSDLLALDQIHPESPLVQNKRGRKRKMDVVPLAHIAESSSQSLAPPEPIREERNDQELGSCISLQLDDKAQESSIPLKHSTVFESSKSPTYFNEASRLDNLNANDDFNHDDLPPAELHHGQYTPHHSGLDGLEGMPNFPGDELPSLLQETDRTRESRVAGGTCEIATDWNDYDFSPSGGMPNVEEQMENETTEQFEERVLNKRAAQLFFAVKSHLIKQNCLLVSDLTAKNSKKQAAQIFYSLLVLKKFRALEISQSSPYADILVSRGPLFDNPKL